MSRPATYSPMDQVISREETGKEVTWSMGEYVARRDIWKAFNPSGDPPTPVGVYENQPSPLSTDVTTVWTIASGFLLLLIMLAIAFYALSQSEQVFTHSYTFDTNSHSEASFVSDEFELKGRTSNVELITNAHVDNNCIYLNYALINEDTGQAFDLGVEVGSYQRSDEDAY